MALPRRRVSWRDRTRPINRWRWDRVRRIAFARDNWRCRACGKAGRLEAHHVRPLHQGGAPYDLDNLETLCRPCHIDRHRPKLTPGEAAWRALVDGLVRLG